MKKWRFLLPISLQIKSGSRILQYLIVTDLVKKLPDIYGAQSFITMLP